MKSAKLSLRMGILIPALLLIGCQGQSAFKRETNPVKSYAKSISDSRAWKPGIKRENAPAPDNTQNFCGPQFFVTVQGDTGSKMLTFQEGVESTYQIDIRPQTSSPYKVVATLPKGAVLKPLREGVSYQLIWKPSVKTRVAVAKIRYVSPELEAKCDTAEFSDKLNLVVNADEGSPVLTVTPPPQSALKYKDSFPFKVSITDPAGTADQPPTWTEITSNLKSLSNAESRSIGAKDAATCESTGKMISDVTWEFNCTFESEKIKDAPVGSGETLNAIFFVKGISQRTKRATSEHEGFVTSVQVTFPKNKADEAPIQRDPKHGVEIAQKTTPDSSAVATPATAPEDGIKIKKLKPRMMPSPPPRPSEL